MKLDIAGSTALVTGASAGIGEAIARELAQRGARVALAARRREQLQQLADEITRDGGRADVFPIDLGQPGSAAELAASVMEQCGSPDILINNAGLAGGLIPLTEQDPANLRLVTEVNFLAPLELARALLPAMLQRSRGAIVTVSSVSAFLPTPRSAIYCATKRAIAAVDEVLRVELAGSGVHALTVYPGPVDTAMLRTSMAADARFAKLAERSMGTTDELSRLIADGIERGRSVIVYPRTYGASRWLSPWLAPLFQRVSAPLGLNRYED